jgi:hypothetical protein
MAFQLTPGKLGFKLGEVLVGLKSGTTDTPESLKTTEGQLHTLLYAWNPDTLAFEVSTTGGQGVGQEVYVTNLLGTDQAVRLDTASSTVTYVGKAPVGTAENAAGWKLFRLTSNAEGDLTIEYADGNSAYDNTWAARAALSYS